MISFRQFIKTPNFALASRICAEQYIDFCKISDWYMAEGFYQNPELIIESLKSNIGLGALGGAGIGAGIGSYFGGAGIGTLAGAGLGALGGAAYHAYKNRTNPNDHLPYADAVFQKIVELQKFLENAKKTNKNVPDINDVINEILQKANIKTNIQSQSQQQPPPPETQQSQPETQKQSEIEIQQQANVNPKKPRVRMRELSQKAIDFIKSSDDFNKILTLINDQKFANSKLDEDGVVKAIYNYTFNHYRNNNKEYIEKAMQDMISLFGKNENFENLAKTIYKKIGDRYELNENQFVDELKKIINFLILQENLFNKNSEFAKTDPLKVIKSFVKEDGDVHDKLAEILDNYLTVKS
jgi:hypothetical protein